MTDEDRTLLETRIAELEWQLDVEKHTSREIFEDVVGVKRMLERFLFHLEGEFLTEEAECAIEDLEDAVSKLAGE